MKKYDVIIIGAGIAGITFGYLMKMKNKKVLIIEKSKISNKDKLCGGLLTKKSYNLLKSIFNINSTKLNFNKSTKCIINNNNNIIDIDLEIYSIYRKELDNYILNEYLNIGGELIDETQYQKLNLDNNSIEINQEEYKYNFLVGADGIFSSLRKEITGRNQDRNFAMELLDEKKDKNLEIFFFDNFKGYGWIIPNIKNNMIGIGNVNKVTKIEDNFNAYLKNLNIKNENIRGAFLPTGDDIYLNYKNVFFIGDSAGLISPITGEGIYYALMSAKILSENLNNNYSNKMKKILKEIKRENLYKKYVYNDKIRNFLFSRYNNIFIKKIIIKFANKIL